MANKKKAISRQLTHGHVSRESVPAAKVPKKLVSDLRKMIDESRQVVSQTVNSAPVLLYWQIGRRIRQDVLRNKRAEYGDEIAQTLSRQLTEEFGRGFTRSNLLRMMPFCRDFSRRANCLRHCRRQLGWTPFRRTCIAARRSAQTRLLRRDVPRRAMERRGRCGRRSTGCCSSGRRCQQEAGRS